MTERYKNQNHALFGTKIFDYNTRKVGLLIFTWTNVYADGDVEFATCVDINGERYNTAMDNLRPYDDLSKEELKSLNLHL